MCPKVPQVSDLHLIRTGSGDDTQARRDPNDCGNYRGDSRYVQTE